jgi:hypothetical protein
MGGTCGYLGDSRVSFIHGDNTESSKLTLKMEILYTKMDAMIETRQDHFVSVVLSHCIEE